MKKQTIMALKAAICSHILIKKFTIMQKNLITIIAVLMTFGTIAQPGRSDFRSGPQMQEKKEAIEARKVAYITKTLDLTPAEAQVFWPIYNAYNREVEELFDYFRTKSAEMPPVSEMDEAQATEFVEDEIYRFERAAELRRQYTNKMLEVISVEKVAMLFEAERGFNRMLFREAQRRHRIDGRRGQE